MSVLIKGMEMPKSCEECRFDAGGYCTAKSINFLDWCEVNDRPRPSWCPLVEVPEQKHGQWIKSDDGFDESWVCSECMEEYVSVDADFIDYAHYCPNCGARMVSDDV